MGLDIIRFVLEPFDIIAGAQSPAHPRVFVIGAFDSRITFYSQQVRALSLVHALKDQGVLRKGQRVAVVGGGAAGLTAAAATALIAEVTVDLYERGSEILPLQQATDRRRLDPHIYAWPEIDSDDPLADLPLLDWSGGAAREVRRDVKQEFEAVTATVAPRLRLHLRHQVVDSRIQGAGLQLDFRRDPIPGETPGPDGYVPGQAIFDLVLLAFGFGLEPPDQLPGCHTASYWSDAGVPVPEFEGRLAPRFLVSGNGDGGLIDFVAAASANFDHAGMIHEIVHQPNIRDLQPHLEAIDACARKAFEVGNGFDFLAAYDAEILPDLEAMGLVDLVAGRLRPGVRLTLQTLKAETFYIETSILNRLAAYLIIRACKRVAQTKFTHLHGDLVRAPAPAGAEGQAPYWFTCDGQTFGVDAVIVRRGPGLAEARLPFTALLGEYKNVHRNWLKVHGDASRVPTLSDAARGAFAQATEVYGVPPALHVQRSLAATQPQRVRVQATAGGVRWSGDIAAATVGSAWDPGARALEIVLPSAPAQLTATAAALVRLALHAKRAAFHGDVADWRVFAEVLTSRSPHAEYLSAIAVAPNIPGGGRNPRILPDVDLAQTLHRALDTWTLSELNRTLTEYLVARRDSGNLIGFPVGDDLRDSMTDLWAAWRGQFEADAALRDRFFRLLVCAQDEDDRQDEARVLVGPGKLGLIVRATAAALAVAAAWPDTAPRGERPGNLLRQIPGGDTQQGHVCAAELIRRRPIAIAAVDYVWGTHFVLLSNVTLPVEFAVQLDTGFTEVDAGEPSLSEPQGAGRLIVTLDEPFRDAAEAGLKPLTALLETAERRHFANLRVQVKE